jgi:hypothetical protein
MFRFPIQGIISIAQKARQIGWVAKTSLERTYHTSIQQRQEFIEVVGDAVGRLPEDVLLFWLL